MSLFRSMISDGEEDLFFGTHMRHMRQMNNMMNSLFSDPFGMLGGEGPLAIMGSHNRGPLMPFMPQIPSLNRLLDLNSGAMGAGSTYSSTVIMSNGPNGAPQVYSTSSSTKVGPNGVKETRKTLEDSRTGTKKMSIGHHIGERAHVIEREQNLYTGDAEERQEFINLDEEEAEHFDREFQQKAGMRQSHRSRAAICEPPRREPPRLALPAPPAPNTSSEASAVRRQSRPSSRRPLRTAGSSLPVPTTSQSVRDVYGSAQPQRHRPKHHKTPRSRHQDN